MCRSEETGRDFKGGGRSIDRKLFSLHGPALTHAAYAAGQRKDPDNVCCIDYVIRILYVVYFFINKRKSVGLRSRGSQTVISVRTHINLRIF